MTRSRWIIFALICAVILGGLVWISNSNRVDVSKLEKFKVIGSTKEFAIADHVYGSKDGKVTIIEYGDFQCPGCASLHPVLKPMLSEYQNQITFVFRNFPLTNIHPNALAAAAAAEAAGKQGKFYAMHDVLYSKQAEWQGSSATDRTNLFRQYAEIIGLDLNKYDTDVKDKDVTQKIRRDQALGGASKVENTPSLFINGNRVNSDILKDPTKIEEAIKKAILESGQELPKEKKQS
ncbi:MAG TPA: thioredoxin domain-containing protein [Candidatus Saccharimonadales bacterium]